MKDLTDMFYPHEMRRADPREEALLDWKGWLAVLFVIFAVVSFVKFFIEPTHAEAKYGYAQPVENASDFCIQARADHDSLGKPFMGELANLCGV